jgi:hypothetical protein
MLSSCRLLKSLPLAKPTQDAAMRHVFCLSTLPPQGHQLFFQGGQLSNPLGHVFDVRGIPLLVLVLRRTRRPDDRCVNDRLCPNFQPSYLEHLAHLALPKSLFSNKRRNFGKVVASGSDTADTPRSDLPLPQVSAASSLGSSNECLLGMQVMRQIGPFSALP